MCERKAENYSAGTSLVIISCPRSPFPEMVETAGTKEAELGLARFGALSKGAGLRDVNRISRRYPMLLLELDFPCNENTAHSTAGPMPYVFFLSPPVDVFGAGELLTVLLPLSTP